MEIKTVNVRSTIDFTPLVEVARRSRESLKLVAAAMHNERAIVVTGQDGVTRVHLRGKRGPGLFEEMEALRDRIAADVDRKFLLGPDA